MKDSTKMISTLIKEQRAELRISQRRFAFELSRGLPKPLNKRHISKWENGHSAPDIWLMFSVKMAAEYLVYGKRYWATQLAEQIVEIILESEAWKKESRWIAKQQNQPSMTTSL